MNFLSITFDDLNAFAFLKSLYGGALQTPNIDRVMAMGTTFENAFAQVAVCNASRSSVLSGLDPGLSGVHANFEVWYENVDPSATLPAILKNSGYDTSVIGKVFHNVVMPKSVTSAISDYFFADLTAIGGHILDTRPLGGGIETHSDYINVDHAIEVLNGAGSDPFAMFLGIAKPHLGWVVPQEYFDLYPLDDIELPFTLDGDLSDVPEFMRALVWGEDHSAILDAGFWKSALQGYFASISFADAMLGRVLDTLEANGQLGDTAILLWTDHGYHLGDKDNWHKFTLWEEAARAPVVRALPGAGDDGQKVGQVVELVDIMPTVLDLLGMEIPAGLSGRSLVPFIADPGLTDGGIAVTTMYGSAAIRTNDYRYIRYEDGSTELYDLRNDPNQWHNLAADPAWQAVRTQLDAQLRSELTSDGWHLVDAGGSATGTQADELFVLAPGGAGASGGGGDDTYFITDHEARISEAGDGGTDRVYTSIDYTLPDHVEELHLKVRDRNQTLIGNAGDNFIVGSNHLEGLDGNDRLRLWGNGFADGGAGEDQLLGGPWREDLRGGDGNDVIAASSGIDSVEGGAGDDRLDGGGGADTVSYASATAAVTITLGAPNPQNTVGAGIDTLLLFENITGSAHADRLTGDGGVNVLKGGAGDDLMIGGGGDDTLDGGEGVDTVSYEAATGAVDINIGSLLARNSGAAGADRMLRVENLIGSGWDDIFVGSGLANRIEGGAGEDTLRGQSGSDALHGGDDKDLLFAGFGNDSVNGEGGDDLLFGELGNDAVDGGGGRDRLLGQEGADTLAGGDGNDVLRGGIQKDMLTGGAGTDQFVFEPGDAGATTAAADRVADFTRADGDRINLRAIDADSATPAVDDRFRFIGAGAFSGDGAGGELRYRIVQGNSYIEGDTNGDGAADFVIRLDGAHALVAADFVL
ncbi:MAG TPA: sulfatase-like hydrolase/transferase [Allosphingosinicella sp.]|nr:sulfatase-like hydrolase/transferase [Allosphingosinicella sp.]